MITSSTGSRRAPSTIRSSSSREVGSIQWASSNTISTGRCRVSASNWLSTASNSFSRLRCGLRLSVRGGIWQRQQLAQQRDLVVIPRARREQRPEFAELGFDCVVAGEPGGAFELDDEGIKRAVLVVRRGEIA